MGYVKNYDSIATNDSRKLVMDLVETAFASVAPHEVFKSGFSFDNKILKIQDKSFDLNNFDRVFLVGFGKGSAGNAKILEEKLGDVLTDGWVNDVVENTFNKIHPTKGSHPLPSQQNFDFTNTVLEKLSGLTERDFVLIVTCGGGSVLLEAPHKFTLEEMIAVNTALLRSGATITEMNVIRKHLSKVKGGGLAKHLYPATVANLIFSDVPGNDLSVIASGPLVKDKSSIEEANQIYTKYKLDEYKAFTPEDFVETPKEEKYYEKVSNILMLSNLTALNAMEKLIRERGYVPYVMTDRLQGDARKLGEQLINETLPGHILIAGGESTMKVTGKGLGGRNQELVLAALPYIKEGTTLATFSTDGWDFYWFCGALADMETVRKVQEQEIDVESYLEDDNSYGFFEHVGDGIQTGKQESNVSDLFIVLKESKA